MLRKCCFCCCDILTGCKILATVILVLDVLGLFGSVGDLAKMGKWIEWVANNTFVLL